jgi:putative nucleotidyltransferase with HDIG domain
MRRSSDRRARNSYLLAVVSLGAVTVLSSLWELSARPPGIQWFILAGLTLLTGSFTVKLPSLPAKISVSETFVFTSVLLFGPAAGTITVVLDALVISLWMRPEHRSPTRVIFNATAPAIAIRVASEIFFYLSGAVPGQIGRQDVGHLILPVFTFALLYFVINTALVSGALATERSESPIAIWLANFPSVSITYFVGSSVAMLIVAYTDHIDLTVLSIIVPLLAISYLTFRTSMGRIEDADRHVAQVNELYLSTIETLAMAVDAKDQITHGHIRRVQVYAIELAKRLGIRNNEQLRAIEAAALLHDMGKLAIPEHILNKPGQLTQAEFDKMKRHADIGADLLSSVRFPYPIVPIVRHHHENWNGTGYPSGLSGTDIPFGARVLSVVDCFDALTSDRPYRPRLTPREAFSIIEERRGTMYDPLVVDTFIASYNEISPLATLAGQQARTLVPALGAVGGDSQVPLRDIRDNAAQAATLGECLRDLDRAGTIPGALAVAGQYLRLLTPGCVCALYRYQPETDSLICTDSTGDGSRLLVGLSIRNGERITGWVAANSRIIANSDATLDLADVAQRFSPNLRSTMAAPVLHRHFKLGVLTTYATGESPFTDHHKYAFERIAAMFAERASRLTSSTLATLVRFPSADTR